jgi:DNA-binding MarR family transcriptional regulator
METYEPQSLSLNFSDDVTGRATALTDVDLDRELHLLEQIEADPDITQATLADRLDVAVGTVNWHLKRLVSKGYVKVKRAQRRKLRYIITPEGIALRARLTVNYIETSMNLYRRTRQRVRELLAQVKQNGGDSVVIDGEGDIADICRLTCLEQGIHVIVKEYPHNPGAAHLESSLHQEGALHQQGGRVLPDALPWPTLEVRGAKVYLK